MADRTTDVIPPLVSGDSTWTQRGSCRITRIDPDTWFPIDATGVDAKIARAVCAACPVREPCAADAAAWPDTVGIWGGLDERERRNARRRERERGKLQ